MSVLEFFVQERTLMLKLLSEHLVLTFVAVGIAAAIALPMGIVITRVRRLNFIVVGAANLSQTVPSLAVLGLCIPFLGIGFVPSVVALVLRAMLPIVVNTYVGIEGLERSVVESARGMGMRDWQILSMVELPLALPVIMAGLRNATVMSISIATLAGLIGGGGLGELIFRGVAMVDYPMVLAGAIPTAALAIGADVLMGRIEFQLTPKGVRV